MMKFLELLEILRSFDYLFCLKMFVFCEYRSFSVISPPLSLLLKIITSYFGVRLIFLEIPLNFWSFQRILHLKGLRGISISLFFFQEPFPRVSCEFLRIITSSSTGFFFLFYFLLKRDSCRCSIIAKRIKSWRGFSQKNDRFEPKQSARVGINDQNNVIIDD